MKEMKTQVEFLECACTSEAHTLKFKLETYSPDDIELYTSVFLNQYHNFFGRIWIAIKYIFGYKCKYGHWDCFVLRPEDVDRLAGLLRIYKRQLNSIDVLRQKHAKNDA